MSILSIVKELCDERGISINQFEKMSGITRGSVAKWDDHSPSADKVKQAADFFGVSVDYLLTGEIKKPTTEYGDGLSERKRKFIADVYDMTDEQVELLQRLVDQIKGRA